MQFKLKLTNKALEIVKKPNFRPDFGLFTPYLKPPKFFLEISFDELLNIVRSYYHIQFKVKLTNKALENVKKPNFGPDFGLFTPNLGHRKFFLEFYFHELLNTVRSYYLMQFKVKLMNEA